MGKAPCCEKIGLKKGRWTAEEDEKLIKYIEENGEGSWKSLPKNAGLLRCGKSCRLRWINYLRSDLKRGNFTSNEEELIIKLHATLGNRWSLIAAQLPGRTDNEVKNYWNSHLSRKIHTVRRSGDANGEKVIINVVNVGVPRKRRRGRRTSIAEMQKNRSGNTNPLIKNFITNNNNPYYEKGKTNYGNEQVELTNKKEDNNNCGMTRDDKDMMGLDGLLATANEGSFDSPLGPSESTVGPGQSDPIIASAFNVGGSSTSSSSSSLSSSYFDHHDDHDLNWGMGMADAGQELPCWWGEKEQMISWLWETDLAAEDDVSNLGDSEEAMLAWLLS